MESDDLRDPWRFHHMLPSDVLPNSRNKQTCYEHSSQQTYDAGDPYGLLGHTPLNREPLERRLLRVPVSKWETLAETWIRLYSAQHILD
jgi:hypothetical protein